MPPQPERRAFQTLDGLRGVGAGLVVMRHVPSMFGGVHVPESFLAVDLFYLVSGFVVAHAYGERLKTGGFLIPFVKTRIIRLYPLYAVGIAIGVVSALISIIGDPHGWWTWARLAEALATGAILFPFVPGLDANGSSLDGPTWTLLPEIIANAVYAALIRWMKPWGLVVIAAVSAVGVYQAEQLYGTLDVGYNSWDFWTALARVGFSFFAGVLVFRYFGTRRIQSNWASWGLVLVLGAILAWTPPDDWTDWYELGAVLVAFPLLLIAAAHFEPGPRAGAAFSKIGLVSYGVYILHQPMGNLARSAINNWPALKPHNGWISGLLFMAAVGGLAWWLDDHYDAPVRKVLRAKFLPAKG